MQTIAIDRARYFLVPRTQGPLLLALARLLRKRMPNDGTPELIAAAKALDFAIILLTQAFVARHLEASGSVLAEEGDLDLFVDALWYATRDRLEHWWVFERSSASRLAAKQTPDSFDYEALIERAKLARRVHALLLGTTGVDFTRLSFAEQAEYMRTLWEVIEQEELEAALSDLIGAEFFEALRDSQAHYVEMTEDRATREKGSTVNLRDLAGNLRQAVQNYLIALLAMIKDDDPKNVAMIKAALRPVDALREELVRQRSRARPGSDAGNQALAPSDPSVSDLSDLSDPDQAEELSALIAEEQAIVEEFGAAMDEEPEVADPVQI